MKKILIISPEAYPKVKVGGLGKATSGLKKGLEENGVEVKLVASEKNIYTPLFKKETETNNRILGRRAAELCLTDNWQPDFVWGHDWGGVWSLDEFKKFNKAKTVWTVHSPVQLNGAYGNYAYGYSYSNENESIDWGDSFFDFAKLIKQGICLSDKVTTVSNNFARTLRNNELFESVKKIEGINNGIDLAEWNPRNDRMIKSKLKYSWSDFRMENKRKVQEIMGLDVDEGVPMFIFVSRLVSQKGLDLLLEILPKFLANNKAQFVFLGGGNEKYLKTIKNLRTKFKGKLGARLEADFEMPHQLYAGADFLVLPSISEPFGLVVSEAKRYGVIPIVHAVDGLSDQVVDHKNGFSFNGYNKINLEGKLLEALKSYESEWQLKLREKIGLEAISWNKSSNEWLSCLYA